MFIDRPTHHPPPLPINNQAFPTHHHHTHYTQQNASYWAVDLEDAYTIDAAGRKYEHA